MHILPRFIFRPYSITKPYSPNFVQLLRKIHSHGNQAPTLEKIREIEGLVTKERIEKINDQYAKIQSPIENHQIKYNKRLSTEYRDEARRIDRQEFNHAYACNLSYSASGGFFSAAQRMANISGFNIRGIIGENLYSDALNIKQQVLFKPQNIFLSSINRIGNLALSKRAFF
ncbi:MULTISPECIES: hypothetical protein [Providencia]|uniref:hypothetical protein n=1 Tax=Providencia TaxID=586 RepID=UPI000838A5CF|nr:MULTISPECIES: hypothetical protein [Providencia]MBP6122026.1 hypothetical protein [Providencia sp.]NIH24188.1 hypothetical protein [Providencia heimbachae]